MQSSDNPFYCICIVHITKYFCKQIVLQDTEDDESSAGIAQDPPESGDPHREDFREDHVAGDEIPRLEPKYFDGFPQDYNGRKKEIAGRRMPFINSCAANIPNGDEKNLKRSTFICMLMFSSLLYFIVITFISFYRHP